MGTLGRRRAFGQHFLSDPRVIQSIVDSVIESGRKAASRQWVEIGPGQGALTEPLLRQIERTDVTLTLIEKDRKIAETWTERLKGTRHRVMSADFLSLSADDWLEESEAFVFSNLPYSVGTRIFIELCRLRARVPRMVLMFQAEVAKRIRSEPSTPDRGSLSVFSQNLYAPKKLLLVPPKAFRPPPRVDSEVIELVRRDSPVAPESETDERSRKAWDGFLKKAFSQRRKMIRGIFGKDPKWGEAMRATGINGEKRPEALTLEEWAAWFKKGYLGALLAALLSSAVLPARAQFFDEKSFGSRSASIGGATAAQSSHGLASLLQPAFIVPEKEGRVEFTLGVQWGKPDLLGQNGIIIENENTGDSIVLGGAQPDNASAFGQYLGANLTLVPSWWKLSLGVSTFLPFAPLATIDTGDTFLPEYFVERSRSQQPRFQLGLAIEPKPGLKVGLAFQSLYQIDAGSALYLQTSAGKPSSMRFQAQLKLKAALFAGVAYRFSGDPDAATMGLVFRPSARSEASVDFAAAVRVFGSGAPFTFRLNALSPFYERPLSLEWALKKRLFAMGPSYVQVEYQRWSAVNAPAMLIRNPQTDSCDESTYCPLTVTPGPETGRLFKDVVSFGIGQEVRFQSGKIENAARLGYRFRPSVLRALPTSGDQNYLDTDRHQFGVSFERFYPKFLGYEIPWSWEAGATLEQLVTRTVLKAGAADIGAPGYAFGGRIWGIAASVNWTL